MNIVYQNRTASFQNWRIWNFRAWRV